jgi:hypothetical protein
VKNVDTTNRRSRSEQARINGAKSKGFKTAEGRDKIRMARTKHGVYSNATVLPIESLEEFNAFQAEGLALLQPRTALERRLAEEVIDISWRIQRYKYALTHDTRRRTEKIRANATEKMRWADLITGAVIQGNEPAGTQDRLERQVRNLTLSRSRILADLDALRKLASLTGYSQDLLQLRHLRDLGTDETPRILPDTPTELPDTPVLLPDTPEVPEDKCA